METGDIRNRPLTWMSLIFVGTFIATAFGIGNAVGGINENISRNTKAVEKLAEIAESLRAITIDHEARIKSIERRAIK